MLMPNVFIGKQQLATITTHVAAALRLSHVNNVPPRCRPLSSTTTTTVTTPKHLDPVKLSYTSYESTKGSPATDSSDPAPPPLIVKHGLFGSKSNWNSLCKVLHQKTVPQRKIVAIDARNHGDSPHSDHHTYEHLAVDIKCLYDDLRIAGSAALLGHSMGGRAVMFFALKYPALVERLIVADISPVRTSVDLSGMPPLFDALRNVRLPRNVSLSTARTDVDKQLMQQAIGSRGLRNFLLTNLIRKVDGSYTWRLNIPALISNFKYIAKFPEYEAGASYGGPVLFLAGGDSDYLQREDHPEILKLFPKAEFRYIEGAGHWLHSEKPTEFLYHTIEFLNRTTQPNSNSS